MGRIAKFILGLAAVLAAFGIAVPDGIAAQRGKAKQQKMINAYSVGGTNMTCGKTPIMLSNEFWDYGGAIKGMIILNPRKLRTIPTTVRMYIYAHECGHQYVGGDESAADCYAVKRGRKQGWLSAGGLKQICNFFKGNDGDFTHRPGIVRCRAMQQCYAQAGGETARGD